MIDSKQIPLFGDPVSVTLERPDVPRREQDVHEHSRKTYHEELPRLSERAQQVFDWLAANGQHTDREVMTGLGFTDMNAVRPRITELIDAGLLYEVRCVTDGKTGKTVRVVDLIRHRA